MKVHYKKRITGTISLMASLLFLCMQVAKGETKTVQEFNINKGNVTITDPGDYLITGEGKETSNTIKVNVSSSSGEKPVNITILGVKINTNNTPFSINGYVNLTVEGENCFLAPSSGSNSAGIQVESGNTLIITESSTGSLTARGANYAAGIGGNQDGDGGNITIQGGTVIANGCNGIGGGLNFKPNKGYRGNITITGGTVTATGNGAGIGGHFNGEDEINITGGTVTAESTGSGAGIGGKSGSSGGIITISGGIVTAKGGTFDVYAAAGIGCGTPGDYTDIDGGTITISGGTVIAEGGESDYGAAAVGIGGYVKQDYRKEPTYGESGTFSTNVNGTKGNAFIIASSIRDESKKDSEWSGAIILGATGKVYGNSVTLSTDAVIPDGKTLTVESGQTLTVADGVTLAVEEKGTLDNKSGTVNGAGTVLNIENKGTINGTVTTQKIGYEITYHINDGSGRTETGYVATGEAPKNLERSFYTFKEWRDAAGASAGNVVTKINGKSTLYAQWTANTFELTSSDPDPITYGKDISYDLTQLLPADMMKKTGGVSNYAFKGMKPDGWAISGSTVTCTKPAADTNGKEIPFTITARNKSTAEATVKFVVNKATPVASNFTYTAPTTPITYDKEAKTATVKVR